MTDVTTKRTAAQIVDAVAEAAYDLFVERSPSAVSLREIATAANVNLGLIHRYVGSKDEVIALVLERHTRRAQTITELGHCDLMHQVADAVVNRPSTGRLIAGMILDGVDVAALKDDFPLLEQLAKNGDATSAAMTYALALGWEVFGSSLIAALGTSTDPNEVVEALKTAMNAIQATDDQRKIRQNDR
jgi:AcrR family transcriptional regulator